MNQPGARRRILYAQYTNPGAYPPLINSALLFANAGWQVLVLGIQDNATRALTFPAHPRITVKALPLAKLGWQRALYFLRYNAWVLWWTLRLRPAWLYASDLYATPAALAASHLPFVKVIYHEHDTPVAARRLAQWCMRARSHLARRAALCILPNAERAKRFAGQFHVAEKTQCVWNCPTRGEVAPPPLRTDTRFRLLYHGTLVPSRLPLTVIDALAQLPDAICLRLVGYETIGHSGYMEKFFARARELQVAARIEWLGAVPRTEVLRLARECDAGLALLPLSTADPNEQTMVGASNKPFDYMACGLDLIVSDLQDWCAMFVEPGFGRACNPQDAVSIATAVRWFYDRRMERSARGAHAQAKILNDWNYEAQFVPVFAVM